MAKTQQTNAKRRSDRTSPASPGTDASNTRTGAANRTMPAKQAARTSATNRMMPAKQAARTGRTATAKKQAAGKVGGKRNQTKAQREAAPSPDPVSRTRQALTPIRTRQTPRQIIAAVAVDSGVEAPIVERVARSLSQTLTRHLIRNGSGRVEIPFLGAALWRGHSAAQKARTMFSPVLKREVQIPSKRAQPAARFRPHSALREIVART